MSALPTMDGSRLLSRIGMIIRLTLSIILLAAKLATVTTLLWSVMFVVASSLAVGLSR